MGKIKKVGYELCDVNIIQAEISMINHRSECDTMIEMCGRKVYPVIVAPMAAVTDARNYKVWLDNNFICVIPRTVEFYDRMQLCTQTFCSFSLDEASVLLKKGNYLHDNIGDRKFYVCIDIAQGTMLKLYSTCLSLREHYGKQIEIMTGNVATPLAYPYYAESGIDYIRLNIGSGSRCTTACNVGIHYPVASLIDDICDVKKQYDRIHGIDGPKIIADGGISNFDDIQKCLALGAFAVMNGSYFAKMEEACGPVRYLLPGENFNKGISKSKYDYIVDLYTSGDEDNYLTTTDNEYINKGVPYREYYGMSTKRAQQETGNVCSKTSEGVSIPVRVEYPVAKWADNMRSFLASAMSYTNSKNIDELRENTEIIINLSGDKAYRK